MSVEIRLRAEKRAESGKGAARKLRAQGRLPAVLYGKGSEALSLSLEAHEAELLFQSISVENTILGLEVGGQKTPIQVLIREIQVHPFRPQLLHVDFYRIRKGEKLEVVVPVHLEGTPVGVRRSDGVLQHVLHEVSVRCLPNAIPDALSVDVSGLDVGDSVHVADLALPEGVELLADPDQTVCAVAAQRAAEVAAPTEAEEAEEPEVGDEAEASEEPEA